jgi:hypothetical protein
MPSLDSGRVVNQPPMGVFTEDLFKPSIRLKEDVLVPAPETSPDEGSSVPTPGTPSGENDSVPVLEANSGASARPIEPSLRPEWEVGAVVRPPSPEAD